MSVPMSAGPVPPDLLQDLAAANRILVAQGVFDAAGHVSMRHPSASGRFIMSRAMAPALVRSKDLIELDLDGVACAADGRQAFIERFIHAEIYKARPDVMAVAHSHSASVIPFGLTGVPLRAMYHNAAFLAAGVPVFDIRENFGTTSIVIDSPQKGAALAATLADKAAALLRAHGMVTVGPSLQAAVFRAVFTESSARIQQQAMAHGAAIAALEPEEGRLADAVNLATHGRAWDLWKQQAMAADSTI